jgi:hypothetical protein
VEGSRLFAYPLTALCPFAEVSGRREGDDGQAVEAAGRFLINSLLLW